MPAMKHVRPLRTIMSVVTVARFIGIDQLPLIVHTRRLMIATSPNIVMTAETMKILVRSDMRNSHIAERWHLSRITEYLANSAGIQVLGSGRETGIFLF
jgi:hypothetical protein